MNRVVPALQYVVPVRSDDGVSFQIVVSRAAVNDIVPGATADQIVPVAAIDLVITAESLDYVIARGPNDDIVPLSPHDCGNAFFEPYACDDLGSGGSRESKQRYQHDDTCGASRCGLCGDWTHSLSLLP